MSNRWRDGSRSSNAHAETGSALTFRSGCDAVRSGGVCVGVCLVCCGGLVWCLMVFLCRPPLFHLSIPQMFALLLSFPHSLSQLFRRLPYFTESMDLVASLVEQMQVLKDVSFLHRFCFCWANFSRRSFSVLSLECGTMGSCSPMSSSLFPSSFVTLRIHSFTLCFA